MPTLYKYVNKDGHYIRGYLPWLGNTTLQVTPEALYRIHAEIGKEEGHFSDTLLQALFGENLVYTKGLHPIDSLPRITVSRATTAPLYRSACQLIFLENEPTWSLALCIVELPKAWVERVDSLVDALSGWRIRAAGTTPAPATQLWSGRGGMLLTVSPQSEPYLITAEGHWPNTWNVQEWLGRPHGLHKGATLFKSDTGERLEAGTAVEEGNFYTLVVPDTSTALYKQYLPPPAFLTPENLGRSGAWQAWSIQIPISSDNRVRDWCAASGYRLVEPHFRLSLITPPQGYSDRGLPIITIGEEVVLGLMPVGTRTESKGSLTFYTKRFQEPGTFRIDVEDSSDATLHVVVEQRSTALHTEHPSALLVNLKWHDVDLNLHSYRDGVGPHKLQGWQFHPGETPTIEVNCAVPLCLTWEIGTSRERHEFLSADEVSAIIARCLQEAARCRRPLNFQLDAGSYGRLSLEVAAPVSTIPPSYSLDFTAERRVRWLATVLQRSQHGEVRTPLSASAQHALTCLSDIPGCASLRNLQSVPTSLIPHIHAITRLVQN